MMVFDSCIDFLSGVIIGKSFGCYHRMLKSFRFVDKVDYFLTSNMSTNVDLKFFLLLINFFFFLFPEIKNSLEIFPSLDFLRKSIVSNEDASGSVKSASKLQDLHQKLSQIQDYKEVLVDAASEAIYVGAK
jgi:hypothetical protein